VRKTLEEFSPIVIIDKNFTAVYTTYDNVMEKVRIVEARGSRHGGTGSI